VDQRQARGLRKVTAILAIVTAAAVVYVLSIGPAFWIWGSRAVQSSAYQPATSTFRGPLPGKLLGWYLKLWGPRDIVFYDPSRGVLTCDVEPRK
jgi:hypothetical protein